MSTGAPMLSEDDAKSSVILGLDITICRHSKAIRLLQDRFTWYEPSLERAVKVSASASIGRSKFKPTPRLLIIRIAHFIWRMPMTLLTYFECRSGSIVGTIYNSKMLRMSGMNLNTSFVTVRHKFIKSRTTHFEKSEDLKFHICYALGEL